MGSRTPSTPKPGTQAVRPKKNAPRDLNIRIEIGTGKQRVERNGRITLTEDTLRFHTGRTGDQGADFSLQAKYETFDSVELEANGASLTIKTNEGQTYRLHVGKHAPQWKEYLQKPESRLALFGVNPKTRLQLLPLPDFDLADEIEACVPGASAVPDHATNLAMIFFGAEHKQDLRRLGPIAERLRPGGGIWVVYPTSSRGLTEEEVAKAGADVGLIRGATIVISRDFEALKLLAKG